MWVARGALLRIYRRAQSEVNSLPGSLPGEGRPECSLPVGRRPLSRACSMLPPNIATPPPGDTTEGCDNTGPSMWKDEARAMEVPLE